MDIQEIIERSYQATVKRGLINDKTSKIDFLEKIKEEYYELRTSMYSYKYEYFDESELADIVLVCFNMAKHFDIDLIKAIEEKTIYNEKRTD